MSIMKPLITRIHTRNLAVRQTRRRLHHWRWTRCNSNISRQFWACPGHCHLARLPFPLRSRSILFSKSTSSGGFLPRLRNSALQESASSLLRDRHPHIINRQLDTTQDRLARCEEVGPCLRRHLIFLALVLGQGHQHQARYLRDRCHLSVCRMIGQPPWTKVRETWTTAIVATPISRRNTDCSKRLRRNDSWLPLDADMNPIVLLMYSIANSGGVRVSIRLRFHRRLITSNMTCPGNTVSNHYGRAASCYRSFSLIMFTS